MSYSERCPIFGGGIFSVPPTVMGQRLKHVNRCEVSVGCCDCSQRGGRKILRAKFKILRAKYRKPFGIGHVSI
jgi:hypothetical protein